MNIFSWAFGDPQAQQAATTKLFQAAIIKLKAARASGSKVAERNALSDMRSIAAKGSKQAAVALSVANSPAKINAMANKAVSDIKSGTVKVAVVGFVGLAFLVWVYGKGKS